MKPIEEIKPLLESPKKVVITMHQKPDADAMGSSLALYHYLVQKGLQVTVISPTNFPDFLKWMPGADQVLDFESMQEKALGALQGIDLLFCLDFNALYRTKSMQPDLEQLKISVDPIESTMAERPGVLSGITIAGTAMKRSGSIRRTNSTASV